MSYSKANDNWPPKSPHEVLLYTPGGRDRLRRLAECASPSPSPSKRPALSARDKGRKSLEEEMDLGDEDDDEDEATLQLQLQAIQARLKLKKIQKKAKHTSEAENDTNRAGSAPLARSNSVAAASRAEPQLSDSREERLQRSKSHSSVLVPVSPIRRVQPTELSKSPSRILLGIDKGLKGSDMSLKRAPSLRKAPEDLKGPFLQRPVSRAASRISRPGTSASQSMEEGRPKSFSERMAAIRAQEAERQETDLRIQKKRSSTFDINHKQLESYKETAIELPSLPQATPEFSREEVLNSLSKPTSSMPRSKPVPDLRSAMRTTSNTTDTAATSSRYGSLVSTDLPFQRRDIDKSATQPGDITESDASFEPFSSMHLSKRIIPHKELTRILSGKKTFVVPDLLRIVKAPEFSAPDIEEDVVLFAVIASKSDPKVHQNNTKNDNRGKFMIMTLTDLKWELQLFLFDSAFDKFWKLTPGTIIAILNPGFMPPPQGKEATGKFGLTLNSNVDTILEVGSARDLGFCKSVKKDGKNCDSWVDKRHTEFCDYHINLTVEKTQAKRMEVNTMTFGRGRGGGGGGHRFNSRDMTGHKKRQEEATMREKTYDRESHSQIYISKRSTASLLDDVDYDPDAFHRGSSKEERINRRIQAKEKERDLAKKLGALGTGLGADYMRKRNLQPEPGDSDIVPAEPPPDAGALGLLGGKAKNVQLSPINKRKRTNTLSSTAAVGWGGDLTKHLGRMKDGESLQPVKKKTRFVTEKGIRVAGRESFGGEAVKTAVNDFDDDDDSDLVIIRD